MQIKEKHRLLLKHLRDIFPNIKFGVEIVERRTSVLRYWKPKTISNQRVLNGIKSFVGERITLFIKHSEEITSFDTGKKFDFFKVELIKYDGNEPRGNLGSD